MSGVFITDVWAKDILDQFWQSSTMASLAEEELSPKDCYHGMEMMPYEPAVTWARLCSVTVTRPRHGGADYFRLSQPDRVAVMLHVVPPDELIEAIRAYAANETVPHLYMRANSLAKIKVHGR